MKADLIKEFNLPGYVKGKTFADASKAIERKFQDRADRASIETKEALLSRLAEAQEYVKMQDALKNNSTEVPDMMNGEIPAGMEAYVDGGFMDQSKEAWGEAGAGEAVAGLGAGLDLLNTINAHKNIETENPTEFQNRTNVGMSAVTSGAKLAATGAKVGGPLGAAIGFGVGALGGAGGALLQNDKKDEANVQLNKIDMVKSRESEFKYGGKMNAYVNGGDMGITIPTEDPLYDPTDVGNFVNKVNTLSFLKNDPNLQEQPEVYDPAETQAFINKVDAKSALKPQYIGESNKSFAGKSADWLGQNYGEILRAAPIASNLLTLKNLDKAEPVRRDRLDARYTPDYVDEGAMENRVAQTARNAQRALSGASGGDLSALRANILASQATAGRTLSDARLQAENVNRGENRTKQQFDLNVDRANLGQSNLDIQDRRMDDAAYESTKNALTNALAEDVGAIGRESSDRKMIRDMFGYKWNGKYYVDQKGNKVPTEDVMVQLAAAKDKAKENSSMFGGYLKKK